MAQPWSGIKCEIEALQEQKRFLEAYRLLEAAASSGLPETAGWLGSYLQLGLGCEADAPRARDLYLAAIERGDAVAAYNLGVMYASGTGILPVDRERAWHFFERAKSLGFQFRSDEDFASLVDGCLNRKADEPR